MLFERKNVMTHTTILVSLAKPIALGYILGFSVMTATQPVDAQAVVPDGTLNTQVTRSGNTFTIDNGTISGTNLFHSFREFSIPTGGTALFNNAADIQNIFSRVTGSSVSNLDGLIQANGTANLFLLNPNGILFGSNAQLNMGGSFVGTTANRIRFADGTEFSAVNSSQPPLLTISAPIGLQFGQNPAAIAVQGATLQVNPKQTLALVGGTLTSQSSTLSVADGHLALGSVGDNATVSLSPTQAGWAFNYQGVQSFQDLQLTQGTTLNATDGGSIQVQGRRVHLLEGSNVQSNANSVNPGQPLQVSASESVLLDGGSWISTSTTLQRGGDVQITALQVALRNESFIFSSTSGEGKGGEITLQASTIDVIGASNGDDGSSYIVAVTNGSGTGGNLTINADRLSAKGWLSIVSYTLADGDAGNLTINAQRFEALDGAQIHGSTFGAGKAGTVTVNATESIELRGSNAFTGSSGASERFSTGLFASSEPGATGDGGNVLINTGRLSITQGAKVAVNVVNAGDAGNIVIRANEIEVADPIVDFTGAISGIVASIGEGATGKGGLLDIQANQLRVWNGGQITASTNGQGDAGAIKIQANTIDLMGNSLDGQYRSSISARSSTAFSSGSITVKSDRVSLQDGAEISVSNSSTGNSGILAINTNRLTLDNDARLLAEVNGGTQGNIQIQARDLLMLRRGSNIETNATGASTGGNITINAPNIVGLENSNIIANATQGRGGNIDITTQGIIGLAFRNTLTPQLDPANDITASSEFSLNGTVRINNIGVDPNAGLVELPVDFTDASQQIAQGCSPTEGSSFIVSGRGGMPQNPLEQMRGENSWADIRDLSAFSHKTVSNASITPEPPLREATSWHRNPQTGKVELIAARPAQLTGSATCSRVTTHE